MNQTLFVIDAIECILLVVGMFVWPIVKHLTREQHPALAMVSSSSKRRVPAVLIAWIVLFIGTNICGLLIQ